MLRINDLLTYAIVSRSQVAINFPDSTSKSDKVTIRGSKDDVEKCYKYLAQCNKELLVSNYRIEVPISKQVKIIGKERTILQKVSDYSIAEIGLDGNVFLYHHSLYRLGTRLVPRLKYSQTKENPRRSS